jgi:hypothetical protein
MTRAGLRDGTRTPHHLGGFKDLAREIVDLCELDEQTLRGRWAELFREQP